MSNSRQFIICVLNEPDRLNDVLTAFVEAGVRSATVLESQGMGKLLRDEIPIFGGFNELFSGAKSYNKTIFSVIDKSEIFIELTALLQQVLSDEEGSSKGIIFSLPVLDFKSLSI